MDYNAFSYLLTLLQNSFFPEISRSLNDFKKLFAKNFKLIFYLYKEHRKKNSQYLVFEGLQLP